MRQAPYEEAVQKANKLRELRLNLHDWRPTHVRLEGLNNANIEVAVRNMMLREGAALRLVGIGSIVYRVSQYESELLRQSYSHIHRANGYTRRRRMDRTRLSLRSRPTSLKTCGIEFLPLSFRLERLFSTLSSRYPLA